MFLITTNSCYKTRRRGSAQ